MECALQDSANTEHFENVAMEYSIVAIEKSTACENAIATDSSTVATENSTVATDNSTDATVATENAAVATENSVVATDNSTYNAIVAATKNTVATENATVATDNAAEGNSPHTTGSSSECCAELCVFSDVCISQDPSLYAPTILQLAEKCHAPPVPHKTGGLVPGVSFHLCYSHSPYTMLVRGLLAPDGLTALLETLHRQAWSGVVHQLWASIYAMAECSCLVWAR